MTYEQLSINQKIQMKAALQAWAKYSIQHWQADLDKKVYGLRQAKKSGVQRSSLQGYTFGSRKGRTNALRRTWWNQVEVGGGIDRVQVQFLLYGRFLDMGVGRGTSHTDRLTARQLRLGRTGRTRRAWYSKRKGYEIHRLNEVLAAQNMTLLVGAIETSLNIRVHVNL